jgi:COP9 signalosome complex subunit 2
MDDNFIRSYIGDLLRSLRTYYLIDLIKPYTRLELSFLAKVLTPFVIVNIWRLANRVAPFVATERRDPRSGRPPYRIDLGRQSRWADRPSRDEARA